MHARNKDLGGEAGFTLPEVLVVILIISLLAAIAIPSLLNQRGKASDAGAKEMVHTAQVAEESCATDNGGNYAPNCTSATTLQSYEQAIQVGSGYGDSYLNAANGVQVPGVGQAGGSNSYTVTATSTSGDTFSITRSASGAVIRTCAPAGSGGCNSSASW